MSRAKLLEGNSASREIDQTASEGQELVDNEQVGIDLYDDSDEDGDSPNSAYSEPNETCSTGDIGGGQAPLGMQFRDGILDEEHMARPEPDEAGKRKSSCPQGGSVQTPAQGDELPEYSATEEFGESGTGSASSSVWDGILDNNDRALPSRPQALGVEHKAVGYVAAAGAVVVPLVHSPRKATGSDWKSEEEEYNGKAPARSFWEGILEEADKPQSVTAAMRDEIEGHHAQHQVAMVDLCVDTVRISQHGRRTTSEVSAGDYRSPSPSPPPSPPPKRSMSLRAKYVRGSTESSLQNQTAEVPLRERIGSRRGSSSG